MAGGARYSPNANVSIALGSLVDVYLDNCMPHTVMLLGGIALGQAIPSITTHLRSVVCLSVVCHVRAPCLNRSADLDAIWQVHLRGPMTRCVRLGVPDPQGMGCL